MIIGRSDDLVNPAWTLRATADLCRAGVPVRVLQRPGGNSDDGDRGVVGAWIADRFAGVPARSTCAA